MTFPTNSPVTTIDMAGWKGGLNRQADPGLLDPTEVSDAVNVDFGLRGEVVKRRGYAKFTTDVSPGYNVGHFLHRWKKLGGADFLILADSDGEVWGDSDTTLTQAGAGSWGSASDGRSHSAPAATMNDKFYITSTRTGMSPQSFDGTTWTAVTATNFDGTASRFPRARCLLVAHDRMWAGNVKTNAGTDFRSRLHWSDPITPTTWQALDFWDFAPDDGQEITAVVLFGEQIIVFKDTSMYTLAGTDETSFTVFPIDQSVGTSCPGTVANSGAELLFFDHRTGVWKYDGTSYKRIDDKINSYLLAGVNQGSAYKSHGFVYQGRYFLTVPWGGSSTPNRTFVFDGRIEAWTEYDFGWFGATSIGTTMYTVGPKNVVGIFNMWGVDNEPGPVAISSLMATAWMAPAGFGPRQRLRRLDLSFTAIANNNVSVVMRRDFEADDYRTQLINTSPGGALWDTAVFDVDLFGSGFQQILKRTSGWGERWRVLQLRLSDSSQLPWELNRMTMQVSKLGRTKGES